MPWGVPVLSQKTASVCWEACARMMWQWRYADLTGYSANAGAYASKDTGLTEDEMNKFDSQLGLRSLTKPKGANLQHALKWTPVIFTDMTSDFHGYD